MAPGANAPVTLVAEFRTGELDLLPGRDAEDGMGYAVDSVTHFGNSLHSRPSSWRPAAFLPTL